jgi:hypothetical protein
LDNNSSMDAINLKKKKSYCEINLEKAELNEGEHFLCCKTSQYL